MTLTKDNGGGENNGAANKKPFDYDLVLYLFAALIQSSGKVSVNFNYMSSLSNGKFTASALEHKFRDVKKAAKELVDTGAGDPEKAIPATPKKRCKCSYYFVLLISI